MDLNWKIFVLGFWLICTAACKDRGAPETPSPPEVAPIVTEDVSEPPEPEPEPPAEVSALDELRKVRHTLRDQHAKTLMFFGRAEQTEKEAEFRIRWCEGERCAPPSLTLVSSEAFDPGQRIGLRIRYLEGDRVEAVSPVQDESLIQAILAARAKAEELRGDAEKAEEWSRVVELFCTIRSLPSATCEESIAIPRRAMLRRADVYEGIGRYEDADEAYQRALLEDPSHLGLGQLVRFYVTAPEPYRDTYLAEGLLRRLELMGTDPVVAASARIELFLQLGDYESAKAVLSLTSHEALASYRDRFKRGDFEPLARPQPVRELSEPPRGEIAMDERLMLLEELVDDELFGHPDTPALYDLLQELASEQAVKARFGERRARTLDTAPKSDLLPRIP